MTSKTKELETVRVTEELFNSEDFKNPSALYIRDALGDYVFIKTRSRPLAQQYVDTEYGKGKYVVNKYNFNSGSWDNITCR